MTNAKSKLVGLNHVAIEVDDVDTALEFYGKIFEFPLRDTHRGDDGVLQMAFIDMGDQFLAIAAGASVPEGRPFNFIDPWGNHVEIVEYRDVQFSKTPAVLKALRVDPGKSEATNAELQKKGLL